MLTEICATIRNYFTYSEDKRPGRYKIEGGQIVPAVETGEYFAIFGSRKNNGVHKSTDTLEDEPEFRGAIWLMSPPQDFLELAEEIKDWQTKYGGVDGQAQSPYYSESFGGYSYTKSAGSTSTGANSAASGWASVYADRLSRFRRARL